MSSDESAQKTFHEIKNSITILNSSLSLIEKTHPEVTEFDYWSDCKAEINFLRELVENYHETCFQPLHLCRIPVSCIVEKLSGRLRPICEMYPFHFQVTQEEYLPDIYADECRLTSCIVNLLKNAFDAMAHNGTVYVDITREDPFLRVDIRDSGGGITPEVMAHMYEPHFSTKLASSGLGLSITRQYIAEMNGELLCDTRLGKGTTFSIKIPVYTTSHS